MKKPSMRKPQIHQKWNRTSTKWKCCWILPREQIWALAAATVLIINWCKVRRGKGVWQTQKPPHEIWWDRKSLLACYCTVSKQILSQLLPSLILNSSFLGIKKNTFRLLCDISVSWKTEMFEGVSNCLITAPARIMTQPLNQTIFRTNRWSGAARYPASVWLATENTERDWKLGWCKGTACVELPPSECQLFNSTVKEMEHLEEIWFLHGWHFKEGLSRGQTLEEEDACFLRCKWDRIYPHRR